MCECVSARRLLRSSPPQWSTAPSLFSLLLTLHLYSRRSLFLKYSTIRLPSSSSASLPFFLCLSLPLLPRHEGLCYQLWIKFSPGARRQGVRRWTSCPGVCAVLQWHRSAVQPKILQGPFSVLFPLLCSAANLQQASGLFEQAPSSLSYTHTLSMHPLLGYLFIFHPSLHPSCWQPAGLTLADEEICERRKRKIDCSKIRQSISTTSPNIPISVVSSSGTQWKLALFSKRSLRNSPAR